jgi:hypothetical protein
VFLCHADVTAQGVGHIGWVSGMHLVLWRMHLSFSRSRAADRNAHGTRVHSTVHQPTTSASCWVSLLARQP